MLWKASLPNQDHSVTQDRKDNLPSPHPQIPALPPAAPAVDNLSPHNTTLTLDPSSPLPPAALNALKCQVEPMNPLCRQAMVSPTEMESLEKESQKISHSEEKLTPRMSHKHSSGLLKAPVKDSSLVAPGKNVEDTQSVSQCSTSKLATSVPTVDGPNPGIVFFRWQNDFFLISKSSMHFCSFYHHHTFVILAIKKIIW